MDTRNVCRQARIASMLLAGCWLAGTATVVGSVLEQGEFTWGRGRRRLRFGGL